MEVLAIDGVRIAGISAYVPSLAVANDEKVVAATGIPARRVAAECQTVVDLCETAAHRVLADTLSRPDEFGAVVAVSFTQRARMPSVSAQLQARLGLPKGIIAFDVMQACAGWPYGLYLAGLLAREIGRKVLLLDGDVQSEFLDPSDPATAPLLSDGGTATVVEASADVRATWRFSFMTDGEKGGALRLEKGGTIHMDGFGVFRFVATDVVAFMENFVGEVGRAGRRDGRERREGREGEFIFVPHQPNVYMVRQLSKALGMEGQTLVSADRFGNLASASIPATVAAHPEAFTGSQSPANVLVAGFGGGLSVSAGMVSIDPGISLSVC